MENVLNSHEMGFPKLEDEVRKIDELIDAYVEEEMVLIRVLMIEGQYG